MATLQENPDGITLTLPAAGLVKGSRGLFGFSIAWCGFMVIFTGLTVVGPLLGATANGQANTWIFGLFCAVFWAIGIFLMVAAVNMGRRHAIIDVVEDVLLVNRQNLFGLKSHQWTKKQLASISVGPSGMEVNDVPVLELKIGPRDGKTLGVFAGRNEDELRWIAWELRRRVLLSTP